MFENRLIEVPAIGGQVYATRIIASWVRKGGEIIDYHWGATRFYKWCLSLGISDEDIKHMMNLACNGKLELETLAKSSSTKTREKPRSNPGLSRLTYILKRRTKVDDNIRKETALKELKYKIAEVESEICTHVDIHNELRDNIRKEKEESQKLIKEMEHEANVANEKAVVLRRKRDTLVGALRIMEEVTRC